MARHGEDMGVGYDDDTLRAEHEVLEQNRRAKKAWRTLLTGFLLGGWSLLASVAWTALDGLPSTEGAALIVLGIGICLSTWLVTFYVAFWTE